MVSPVNYAARPSGNHRMSRTPQDLVLGVDRVRLGNVDVVPEQPLAVEPPEDLGCDGRDAAEIDRPVQLGLLGQPPRQGFQPLPEVTP